MNAIKYCSGSGQILVSLAQKEGHVIIAITNESEEFTSEELVNLFERFYKKKINQEQMSQKAQDLALPLLKVLSNYMMATFMQSIQIRCYILSSHCLLKLLNSNRVLVRYIIS